MDVGDLIKAYLAKVGIDCVVGIVILVGVIALAFWATSKRPGGFT